MAPFPCLATCASQPVCPASCEACTSCAALALLAANDRRLPFETLAEILPQAERYVGTLSGGMDQAISLLAQEGHAL
ncbi:MAG: hypothetical protein HC774_01205, partial [Sphingomonadales bacterium]|nr:hypothetical protein [Sphingomonadales bacterium]